MKGSESTYARLGIPGPQIPPNVRANDRLRTRPSWWKRGSRAIICEAGDRRYCELYPRLWAAGATRQAVRFSARLSSTGVYPNHNRADYEKRDQRAQCDAHLHLFVRNKFSFVKKEGVAPQEERPAFGRGRRGIVVETALATLSSAK